MRHILSLLWSILWLVVTGVTLSCNSPLFAQGAGDLVGLAMNEATLKELGIAKDSPEFAELSKLAAAKNQDVLEILRNGQRKNKEAGDAPTDPLEARRSADRIVQPNYRPALRRLLTAEQFTRLQQLSWQRSGLNALLDDDFGQALAITPEQREKVVAINTEFEINSRNLLRVGDNATTENRETLRKKSLELVQARKRQINEILSPEQREKFSTLLGKPFEEKLTVRRPVPASMVLSMHGLIGLTLQEPILQELGIPSGAPMVAELRKLLQARGLELSQRLQALTPAERNSENYAELSTTLEAKYNAELQKLLQPDQYLRVSQIRVQILGPLAWRSPDIAKALDITPKQRQRLIELQTSYIGKQREILSPNGSPLTHRGAEVREKVQKMKSEHAAKVLEIFTPEQQVKYAELTGKSFDLTLLEPPAPAP